MDPPVHTNHCKHIFHWVTPKNMILGLMNENPWELMVVPHRHDGGNDRIPRTDFVLSQGDFQHLIHGNSGKITKQHMERENSSLCINMGGNRHRFVKPGGCIYYKGTMAPNTRKHKKN